MVSYIGKVFGPWTVKSFSHKAKHYYFNCECTCGNKETKSLRHLWRIASWFRHGKLKGCRICSNGNYKVVASKEWITSGVRDKGVRYAYKLMIDGIKKHSERKETE